jgi:hypothetical protein
MCRENERADWPWADHVDEELCRKLSSYRESPRDAESAEVTQQVYFDFDDGAARAQLVLARTLLSGESAVRVRVTTSAIKFGSRDYVITDAGPLAVELCRRHHGRELSSREADGWSFVVDISVP